MKIAAKKHALKIILVFSLLFLHFFSLSVDAAEKEGTLIIGLIPEMDVFKQVKRFQPLADFLSDRLNTEVKLSMLSRYGNIVERLQAEKLDAAFLGSFTGALAISQLGLKPIVRPVNMDGTSTYFGHIFTRKDSNIKNVADMQGKSFVFVERATTAGYIFPLAYLKKNKVTDLDNFFSNYYFAGSHDATINAVLTGRADIGAAKNTIYERLRKQNPDIDKDLTIIASSPRVPSNGLFVKSDMIHARKERIHGLLMALHESPEGIAVLKTLGAQRFAETTIEDYQPVFDLAADAGIDIKNYHYLNQ